MSFLDPYQYLTGATLFTAMLLGRLWIQPRRYCRSFDLLMILGMLYPFGEMLQGIREVPSFIRWHLSDAGFVFDVMMVCTMSYVIGLSSFNKALKIGTSICLYFFLMEFSDMAWAAFGINTLTKGDPVDALFMAGAYGISRYLVKKIKNEREEIIRNQIQQIKRCARKERKLRFVVTNK